MKHVTGDEAVSKLNSASMSNNTIQRRNTEMSTDLNEQLRAEVGGTELKIWICHTTGQNNARTEQRTPPSIFALCYLGLHSQ